MSDQYLMLRITPEQLARVNRIIPSVGLEIVGTSVGRADTVETRQSLHRASQGSTVTQFVRRQVTP